MRWISEYLKYEQACRELAGKLNKPEDKRALELMAAGWAARAAERKRKIDKQISFLESLNSSISQSNDAMTF
jgi:hypothetical protein